MLQRDRYREVFEMLKEVIMAWFSAGQEGQEKSGSVYSMISLGNFPYSHTPNAPKGTKGMNFQESHNFQSWNLSRNFVPFVPHMPQKAFGAYRIITFPYGKIVQKVTILNAPNTPIPPGVI
jgi:hypothetical protein